jgi:hypothetical protein
MAIFLLADETAASVQILSAALACVLVLLGVVLLGRERSRWVQRLASDESPEDLTYYQGRLRRRTVGSVLMTGCGILLFLGGAIVKPASVALFAATWLGLLVLVVGMMAVAFLDMMATRRFAAKHLQRLAIERAALLLAKDHAEAEANSQGTNGNGKHSESTP